MKNVDDYLKVRHAVRIEGLSERAAARRFGIDPRTVNKMMKFSVPPGYRRKKPPAKPKLDPFIPVIERILRDDKSRPKKQQHTAKRVFERLRDEYGFTAGITIVKDYIASWRQRTQEMFVPLAHPPGHAQADFGEAIGIIGGVERKIHFFAFDLPHSDACFVVGYPAETTEAFCDGPVRAFAFFGGVPQSLLYDNPKIAVARILGDGKRQRTRVFTELQSHYLFEDRFGRPGKGNDKGKVEGLVGYARRNFLVPIPVFESFDALTAHLLEWRFSPAPVSRILRRLGLNRLAALEPAEPVRRYEREHPGELIHIDIKKLGRFNHVGHRITGDRRGQSNSRGVGWEYVHVCIDDASRIAYAEIKKSERKGSAIAFLKAAVAYYAKLGVSVQRVMTDNGSCYKSRAFGRACKRLGLKHIRTRPYTPKTNGKAERFIQTALREWA